MEIRHVTENKSLKRRVRTRMSRTGERYTAARRQVLARSSEPASASEDQQVPADETSQPAPSTHDQPAERGPSDETIAQRTGRPWEEWLADLEAWGASEHRLSAIYRWLMEEHGVEGWWAMTLAVRYEKHIGRRVLGQRGKVFTAGASKTIAASAQAVFDAFHQPEQRARWIPDVELSVRTAKPPRTARFNVGDGTERLIVGIDAKGDQRATVHVEHERLADAEAATASREAWRERLAGLKRMLEA